MIVVGDTHSQNLPGVAALVAEFGFQYEPFDAGHHCFGHCQINHGLTLATGQHISVNDDDDIWTDNARDLMRRGTDVWPDAVLLYQYRSYYGRQVYWHTPGLLLRDHIGGHSVVAPNVQDKLGRFACAYNGDFDYVESTVNNFGGPSKAIWISDLIAIARP